MRIEDLNARIPDQDWSELMWVDARDGSVLRASTRAEVIEALDITPQEAITALGWNGLVVLHHDHESFECPDPGATRAEVIEALGVEDIVIAVLNGWDREILSHPTGDPEDIIAVVANRARHALGIVEEE